MLAAVPARWPYEFLEARGRRPAPRLLQRQGDAAGDSQGHEQGVSLRRRARADGRGDRRRRGAVPPLRRLRRAQARDACATASIARRSRRSSRSTTSRTRPTAAPAGRGRSARAAAITRRTRATATPRRPNLHYCDWIRGWTDVCLRDLRRAGGAQPGLPRGSSIDADGGRAGELTRSRMNHLKAINQQGRAASNGSADAGAAADATARVDVVALQRDRRSQPPAAAHPARLLAGVLAGLGSGSHRRHRGTVSAGRARSVRLPRRLLLAGAGAGSAQPCSRTGRPSARPRRRTGGRSISSSREDRRDDAASSRRRCLASRRARRRADRACRSRCALQRRPRRSAPATAPSSSARSRTSSGSSTRRRRRSSARSRSRPGMPRRTSLSRDRTRFYTIEARHGEGRDHRHRRAAATIDTFTLSEGEQAGPDPQHRAGSAAPLRDAADDHRHQAARPLRDRRRRRWCSTTSRSTRSRAPSRGRTARSGENARSSSRPTAS